jgi:hypothetical protein
LFGPVLGALVGLAVAACVVGGPMARACAVPVFRYALERIESAPYRLVVFHRGPLSGEAKNMVAALSKLSDGSRGSANLEVSATDLAAAGGTGASPAGGTGASSPPAQGTGNLAGASPERTIGKLPGPRTEPGKGKLPGPSAEAAPREEPGRPADDAGPEPAWRPPAAAALPMLALFPPGEEGPQPLWSGPLLGEDLRPLVDSPLRREVVRRLLAGDSAVFLLIESGQAKADQAAATLLQTTLAKMQKSLALPPDDGTGGPHTSLPLRIAFSTMRLARSDPAERQLLRILLGATHTPEDFAGPMVLPIFGRARVLTVLAGESLSADTLEQVGEFLCGNCSCSVKDRFPGTDLLLVADWESALSGEPIRQELAADELRALTVAAGPIGKAALAAAGQAQAVGSGPTLAQTAGQPSVPTADPTGGGRRLLLTAVGGALAAGLLLVVAGSILMRSVGRRRDQGDH